MIDESADESRRDKEAATTMIGSTVSGGIGWVLVVNLIIWTGLFLYLRRLQRKVRRLEDMENEP
ncbi:MAG TPA: CcmD family protein [Thermoanaerobaculia bacterium]|nr:CcmD family protein [Thermoanaerobaculia bacterium]